MNRHILTALQAELVIDDGDMRNEKTDLAIFCESVPSSMHGQALDLISFWTGGP